MNAAIKAIALADDVIVTRAAQLLYATLGPGFLPLQDAVMQTLAPASASDARVGQLLGFLDAHATEDLDDATAVAVARWLLVGAAEAPSRERLVLDCVQNWPDEKLPIGETLAYGVVGALWLILLSTEVSVGDKGCMLHTVPLRPQTIELEAERLGLKLKLDMGPKSAAPAAGAGQGFACP